MPQIITNPASAEEMRDQQPVTTAAADCRVLDDPDAALVNSLRAGDTRAFEILVKRHQALLFKVAMKITRNREDAEDAVQDALLNAFRHLAQFRQDSKFVTWLTRISINQALMTMRAKPRKTTSLDEDRQTEDGITAFDIPAAGYTPEQFCSQHEFERLLLAATAGMNERLSLVWRLRTLDDLTLKEIAQVLGLTLTAVKTRLFRARRELQKEWENKFVRREAYCQEDTWTRPFGFKRVPSHSWFAGAACTSRVSACQLEM